MQYITIFFYLLVQHISLNAVTLIGHRGTCVHKPENTISSMTYAIKQGLTHLEFDVHHCATGEIVVIHDFFLHRTTNGIGHIDDKTLKELQALTIEPSEHIPTLQEVLDCINRQAIVIIELKGANTAGPVAAIIQEYITTKHWHLEDFIIVSFDHEQLQIIRSLLPEIKIGLNIYGTLMNHAKYAQQLKACALSMYTLFTTQEIIDQAHIAGLEVWAWPINEELELDHMKNLIAHGLDGAFVNDVTLFEFVNEPK